MHLPDKAGPAGWIPFEHMEGRFSKPVFPGDRLDTLIWRTTNGARFQVIANGESIVLDRGVFHTLNR